MKITRVIPRRTVRVRRKGRKKVKARAVTRPRYLRTGDLRRFKDLLFAARTIVEGLYSGRHRSPLKGSSPEFIEYKSYVPGDPLDSIDWKAFARTDRHYVKVTEKETDMNCYLLVDCSASMSYRGFTPRNSSAISKYDYAALLAAALAYLVIKQGDKASLTLFDDGIRRHVPCGGTFRHMSTILNQLERNRPSHATSLSHILRKAYGLFPHKGLLVVISDFYDEPAEIFKALSLYTHRRFEIILFHVMHAEEHRLPDLAHARFLDLETKDVMTCAPGDIRSAYDAQVREFIEELRSKSQARRIDYNFVTTETPYDQVLRRYLLRRSAVRL